MVGRRPPVPRLSLLLASPATSCFTLFFILSNEAVGVLSEHSNAAPCAAEKYRCSDVHGRFCEILYSADLGALRRVHKQAWASKGDVYHLLFDICWFIYGSTWPREDSILVYLLFALIRHTTGACRRSLVSAMSVAASGDCDCSAVRLVRRARHRGTAGPRFRTPPPLQRRMVAFTSLLCSLDSLWQSSNW